MHLPDRLQQIQRIHRPLFVVSHSGGKDSQAMMLRIASIIPHHQILVVHADLPGADWEGCEEHIHATVPDGVPVVVARARKRDGTPRTFLNMVLDRGKFPDAQRRQCTSDLKRGPIAREVKAWAKARGFSTIVLCMGERADESSARGRRFQQMRAETQGTYLEHSRRYSNSRWDWWEWHPMAEATEAQVFREISDAGQDPMWVYAAGMTRASCQLCILASGCDINTAARLQPETYWTYVALEEFIDHTMSMDRTPLRERVGDPVNEAYVAARKAEFAAYKAAN